MLPLVAAGLFYGLSALGKGIYGAIQNHKASNIEKNNPRQNMPIQPELYRNQKIAEQMAQTGIPQQAYNNQLNSIARQQAGALSTIGRSANPAGVASVVRAGTDATNNLNAQDAAQRNKNLLLLMQQNSALAGAKQNAWNYNVADRYAENLAKSQAYRGAGTQNIIGGLNNLGSLGAGIAMNTLGTTNDTAANMTANNTQQSIPFQGIGAYPTPNINMGFGTLNPNYQQPYNPADYTPFMRY